MDYVRETLRAYRSKGRATEYKQYHTHDWSWARFCTWRKLRIIDKELARYNWTADDKLLDIPCGTGVLGRVLQNFPMRVVASDISPEMMALAEDEYPGDRLIDFVTADITNTSFSASSFSCVISLGFLHRVSMDVKRAALNEIAALSNHVVIVSCSVSSVMQKFKHRILLFIKPKHVPAPCPVPMSVIRAECEAAGLKIVRSKAIIPFLSSYVLLILEKKNKQNQTIIF